MEKQYDPDARKMHIAMSGILGDKTTRFMTELWKILNEAQISPKGIV